MDSDSVFFLNLGVGYTNMFCFVKIHRTKYLSCIPLCIYDFIKTLYLKISSQLPIVPRIKTKPLAWYLKPFVILAFQIPVTTLVYPPNFL